MITKLKTNSYKKWKLGYCEVLLNEDTYNMVVKYIYVKIWTIAPGNPVFAEGSLLKHIIIYNIQKYIDKYYNCIVISKI